MYIESSFYRKYYDEYEIMPFYLFAVNNYHIFTKTRKVGLVIQNSICDNLLR